MTQPYSGGCACGAIRYQVSGEPAMMNLCQCRQCQYDSGTGHAAHVTFVGAQIETNGEPSLWEMIGEGGTRKQRAFCPTCGSPAYITFPDMPEVFVASAGSLDDPARYRPQIVLWTAGAQAWDRPDPALTRFDKMPPM